MNDRVVTCVFCGLEYPEGTPTSQNEALVAHIRLCEKHPLFLTIVALRQIAAVGNTARTWDEADGDIEKMTRIAVEALALVGVTP